MNSSVLRVRLRVGEVLDVKNPDGSTEQERVKFGAVYIEGAANRALSLCTLAGDFEIWINSPEAFGKLASGHEFYVDFTPVEERTIEPLSH